MNRAVASVVMIFAYGVTLMKDMYPDKKKNALVVIGSGLVLLLFFAGIRYQTMIGDEQILQRLR